MAAATPSICDLLFVGSEASSDAVCVGSGANW
eukprot:COSAG02_NODE_37091_length_446_cov_1.184438_2_plen_31_part_01